MLAARINIKNSVYSSSLPIPFILVSFIFVILVSFIFAYANRYIIAKKNG